MKRERIAATMLAIAGWIMFGLVLTHTLEVVFIFGALFCFGLSLMIIDKKI